MTIVLVLLMIISNICNAVVPTITGTAFDTVTRGETGRGSLLTICLAVFAVVLFGGVVDVAAQFYAEMLGKLLEREIHDEINVSLLTKSQAFHDHQQLGDIMARIINDVQQVSLLISPGVKALLFSLMNLVIPIVFIWVLCPQLLLAPLIFTVVFAISLRAYSNKLALIAGRIRNQFAAMDVVLTESVTNIEVVKSSVQEVQQFKRFEREVLNYRNLFVRDERIQAVYLPPIFLIFCLIGALLHGLYLVSLHQFTIGGLITYIGLMSLLRIPVTYCRLELTLLQSGIASAKRVLFILKQQPAIGENLSGYKGKMRGAIEFKNVTFSYDTTPALEDISFCIEPGQTIAIVGQTGAGKSTLIKLVNRTYDVDKGCILVDGVDVRDWNLDALRSQISVIEQDLFLFSKNISENIAYGLGQHIDQTHIEQSAKDAQAHEFIVGLEEGYKTVVGERGVTLSGGQRQRVAIARAVITNPQVLVLDDATSSVDSATEDKIQMGIDTIAQGRTTLLVTHRLSQIRHANKILILDQGKLIDQGTHEELLSGCDIYRRIFIRSTAKISTDLDIHE